MMRYDNQQGQLVSDILPVFSSCTLLQVYKCIVYSQRLQNVVGIRWNERCRKVAGSWCGTRAGPWWYGGRRSSRGARCRSLGHRRVRWRSRSRAWHRPWWRWPTKHSGITTNKRLSRCWDSATCRLLDACRQSPKLHIFSTPHCSSSVEFWITRYYDPGRLQHVGSQDTNLYCHVPISSFCCTVLSQSTNVTDGWTGSAGNTICTHLVHGSKWHPNQLNYPWRLTNVTNTHVMSTHT